MATIRPNKLEMVIRFRDITIDGITEPELYQLRDALNNAMYDRLAEWMERKRCDWGLIERNCRCVIELSSDFIVASTDKA